MDTLDIVRLWFELLDYCDHDVSDWDYMFLADRFTAWMGRLGEPDPSARGPRKRGLGRQ